jgi:hypothetical protein
VAVLVIERNFPLVTHNFKIRSIVQGIHHVINGNDFQYGCRWWPSWMSGGAGHQNEPSSSMSSQIRLQLVWHVWAFINRKQMATEDGSFSRETVKNHPSCRGEKLKP